MLLRHLLPVSSLEDLLKHRFYAYAHGEGKVPWSAECHSLDQAVAMAEAKLEEGFSEIEVRRRGGEVVYSRRQGQSRLEDVTVVLGQRQRPSALAERACLAQAV